MRLWHARNDKAICPPSSDNWPAKLDAPSPAQWIPTRQD
jgi:hypothetical protein